MPRKKTASVETVRSVQIIEITGLADKVDGTLKMVRAMLDQFGIGCTVLTSRLQDVTIPTVRTRKVKAAPAPEKS